MPGTRSGGKKSAATDRKRYGDDFYAKIGSLGGKAADHKKGGFAYKLEDGTNYGQKYSQMGGWMSKRSRQITLDSELRNDEAQLLIKYGSFVIAMMREENIIDEALASVARKTLYNLVGRGDWPQVFRDCGVGEAIQIVWGIILTDESRRYRQLVRKRLDDGVDPKELLDETEKNDYRLVRNLVAAYEAATGREIYTK